MPSSDLSLAFRLANAGMPQQLAVDVANTIAANQAAAGAIAAVTSGTINGASVGVTTPAVVKTSDLQSTFTDISGTPGNGTINTPGGRCAIAAAGQNITITSSICTANSRAFASIRDIVADATFTNIVKVRCTAGSIVIAGNAPSTGVVNIDVQVFN